MTTWEQQIGRWQQDAALERLGHLQRSASAWRAELEFGPGQLPYQYKFNLGMLALRLQERMN